MTEPDATSNDVVILDAQSLRALSHPLRVHLLGLLRTHGPSTATKLAERTGHSSGLTSYHLRQMAVAGLVVEVAEQTGGRQRWWRAAHQISYLAPGTDPELAEQFLHAVVRAYSRRADTYLDEAVTWAPEWRRGADFSDWVMYLTPAETEQLSADITELAERYRREGTGAQRVALQIQLFPEEGKPR